MRASFVADRNREIDEAAPLHLAAATLFRIEMVLSDNACNDLALTGDAHALRK